MKTTPTLGLKLYEGTDAPDLVSGYNASMSAIDGSGVLASQGMVQDSTDWDTITDAGYYECSNTKFSSANHSPVGSYHYGILVVYKRRDDPVRATQIYYPRSFSAPNRAPVSRALYANGWSAWAPLVYVPEVEGALPANGAAGQVLVKSSASDYDCEWVNPSALINVDTVHVIKTGPGLTAWLKASPSTGEWWSGPGEVTITANGSTQQYTGNWTVYRTPSIGNAYFQGSEGRAATAHFASLKTDHNANWWAFVMSIKDTEPTFQYVGAITSQLTAMLKRVTTFDAS